MSRYKAASNMKMMRDIYSAVVGSSVISAAALVAVFALLSGCASTHNSGDQLYRDLGQQPGIERLVDGLLDNIARDERIFSKFRDSNIDRLRTKLIEKFCSLSGGPCEYTGASMSNAHGGMFIGEAEFNALVEDLIDAMQTQQIPVATQNRLLALLAPLRPQIIRQ
jgi:hemoglobin